MGKPTAAGAGLIVLIVNDMKQKIMAIWHLLRCKQWIVIVHNEGAKSKVIVQMEDINTKTYCRLIEDYIVNSKSIESQIQEVLG